MSKKRAFVRYTKSGEIVPGSLIITTNGGYPDKSSLWKEVTVDQCCDGGECFQPVIKQLNYGDLSLNVPINEIGIRINCGEFTSEVYISHNYTIFLPNIVFTSISDVINYLNSEFSSILGYNIGTFVFNGSDIILNTTTEFTLCPSPFRIDLILQEA